MIWRSLVIHSLPAHMPDEARERVWIAGARLLQKIIATHKQRTGLPKGFGPRSNRYGRTRLLFDNIYRLPDGREFVPTAPSGSLGRKGHRYALLTILQHERHQRGSVYIRNDGRIFDYSERVVDSARELFDTGFAIDDLERTGRYVSSPVDGGSRRRSKTESAKSQASHF